MIEPRFVLGMISKTLIVGGLVAILCYFATGAQVALGVVIGTLVTAINMRTMTWAMRKMLESGRGGKASSSLWSALLGLKLLLLIGVVWVLITKADVNAVGFAIGFSLFMPAIFWQMVVAKPEEPDAEEG